MAFSMLSLGIVGLPNIGKSTLFQAITKKQVAIANYPFTTVEPNIGLAPVKDERLEKIAEVQKSEQIIPATVKFVDIAGLVKGANQGLGLGNQFLAHIREVSAIVEVIRLFKNPQVAHPEATIDPLRDLEIIGTELILADLETIRRAFIRLESEIKKGDKTIQKKFELIKICEKTLQEGRWLSNLELDLESEHLIQPYNFLTRKPVIILLNIDSLINQTELEGIKEQILKEAGFPLEKEDILAIDLASELALSELSEKEIKDLEIPSLPFANSLDDLIKRGYQRLDLITFFTIASKKETRAWPLKRNSTAWEAAGLIHSDFQEKFVKVEVAFWEDFVKFGSWQNLKEKGKLKIEGRDYLVQDGDILLFKI